MPHRLFWFAFIFIVLLASFFRFSHLGNIPVALSQTEVQLLIKAQSLLEGFPVLASLNVGLIGVSEWAVRVPSALAGVGTVVVGGLLARRLWESASTQPPRQSQRDTTPQILQLLTMVTLTLSPWSIMASRSASTATLSHFIWISLLVCVTYHQRIKWLLLPLIISGVLLAPLTTFAVRNGDIVQALMSPKFIEKTADTLSLSFLFVTGDANLQQGTGTHGLFLIVFLPFLFVGLSALWDSHKPMFMLLSGWTLLAAVPATLTEFVPNSTLFLTALVPLASIIGVGLTVALKRALRLMPLLAFPVVSLSVGVIALVFAQFWHYYLTFYPKLSADAWSSGFKEAAQIYLSQRDHIDEFYWEVDDRDFSLWVQAYGLPAIQEKPLDTTYRTRSFRGFEHTEAHRVLVAARPDKLQELQNQELTQIKNVYTFTDQVLIMAEVERK